MTEEERFYCREIDVQEMKDYLKYVDAQKRYDMMKAHPHNLIIQLKCWLDYRKTLKSERKEAGR